MNTWLRKLSLLTLSLAAFAVASSQSPAQADVSDPIPEATSSIQALEPTDALIQFNVVDDTSALNSATFIPETVSKSIVETTRETAPEITSETRPKTAPETTLETLPETTFVPVPGTVFTSASALQQESTTPQPVAGSSESAEPAPAIAQDVTPRTITPGRATRSGPSYIAVGGNIGFGGRTALGRGNFVITSKIGLTNYFSARPGIVVGRSPTVLLPITFDFPVRSAIGDRISLAPFVGGGLAISTRGGSAVRALAVGGIDIPISSRFTATASANAAFFRRPEIGVILGIGYNF